METLIIYDNTGKIFYQVTGAVVDPEGLPFMRITIPDGKILKGVDVSVKPNVPIYEDMPVSELEQLQAKVDYLMMMNGVI